MMAALSLFSWECGGVINGGRDFYLSVPFSTVWNVWLLSLFGFYSIMDSEIEFHFVWLRG